jgi:hypothetical protein
MNRFFFLLLLCCGSATLAVTKEQKNETKQQSMNEPNPITRYVNNVLQKGEGRESKFVLCDPENKSCVQQERSEKHLAVAK